MKIIIAESKQKTIKLLKVSEEELKKYKKKYNFISVQEHQMINNEDKSFIGFLGGNEKILKKIMKKEKINTTENIWFMPRRYFEKYYDIK